MRPLLLALVVSGLAALPARAVDKEAINDAVDRGVASLKKMQQDDGRWNHAEIGATALAGLALLECGVAKTDKAITKAAKKVREESIKAKETYSITLSILFLDRLDDTNDTPLIESLLVRLLAGQHATGGWSYNCPTAAEDEVKRIKTEMDGTRVLKGGRDLKKLPAKGKRKTEDLAEEIQEQLKVIDKGLINNADGGILRTPDNSNTQFATLALWVGRRYGVPTQKAMIRLHTYFSKTQNEDGGWSYIRSDAVMRMPRGAPMPGLQGSTAAMTCAGLLGLAVGHGAALDVKKAKAKGEKVDKQDVSKDAGLKAGLQTLATAVGSPLGWDGTGAKPNNIPAAAGKSYYFFWSLERVAVILNLKTIGKKDWYSWGAEILLGNQRLDGSWAGEYAASGADTSFALLFLKKSNLAEDLSSAITGLTDPGERRLKAGGVGGTGLKGASKLTPSGLGDKKDGETNTGSKTRPALKTAEQKAAFKVADDLVKAKPEGRAALIKRLRETKGVAYTDALVYVIGELDAAGRREARAALAQRFTRLKGTTLREYLSDKDAEVRRAAALAIASKELKELCPDLIKCLDDSEGVVARAAHAALKELSGKDFGPKADATPAQRKKAIADWQTWWKKQARE